VKKMAYLRKEDETVEIDHPLDRVWVAVQKVFTSLAWSVEEVDEAEHRVKVKTKSAPWSYSSVLQIGVMAKSEGTTRVSIMAETPVTTITAIVDFRQGRRRIDMFFEELAKQLAS